MWEREGWELSGVGKGERNEGGGREKRKGSRK